MHTARHSWEKNGEHSASVSIFDALVPALVATCKVLGFSSNPRALSLESQWAHGRMEQNDSAE